MRILDRMNKFYSDESKWCQHYFFKDSKNKPLTPENGHKADKCCLLGCYFKITKKIPYSLGIRPYPPTLKLLEKSCGMLIPIYNNCHSFKEVKEVINKAIKLRDENVPNNYKVNNA